MSKAIGYLATFAAGLGIGGFLMRVRTKNICDAEKEEEISSVIKQFNEELRAERKEAIDNDIAEAIKEEEELPESEVITENIFTNDGEEVYKVDSSIALGKVDYTQYSKEEAINKPNPMDILNGGVEQEEKPKDPEKPFVVTEEEADEWANENYETVFLTWYKDMILANEYDEVVQDFYTTLGKEAMDILINDNTDLLHVVNPRLKVVYEIDRALISFPEAKNLKPLEDEIDG